MRKGVAKMGIEYTDLTGNAYARAQRQSAIQTIEDFKTIAIRFAGDTVYVEEF
jgi:hypothetical protein